MGHTTRHLQRPRHHRHVWPRYITPPMAGDNTLTIDATGNTTVPYVTLIITIRTTTLTISVHDTTSGTNTTSDRDSDSSDWLTHPSHHQLTRSLHQPHLH